MNNILTNLNVAAQLPNDPKVWVLSKTVLSNLGTANNLAYTYYQGMRVYCAQEKEVYEWREVTSPGETGGLVASNFIYPVGLVINGVDYSAKEYNFFKVLQASDITIPDPVIGTNVGLTGVGLVHANTPTEIQISKVFSSSINITKQIDGTVTFEVAETNFNYLKAFYVNSNYVPTLEAPADGSIIRPFPTYDEAKLAFIGSGTLWAPEFQGAAIIMQTNSTTSNNPSVNYLILEFQNGVTLAYTGDDDYMFDTEVILTASGELPEDLNIEMELTGQGSITRQGLASTKVGLVRALGSNRGVGVDLNNANISRISIAPKDTDNITLIERTGPNYVPSTWDGDITYPNGVDGHTGETLESFYGTPHKYSLTLAPTQPLIYMDHRGFRPFGYSIEMGGKVTIVTLTNVAIYAGSNAELIVGREVIITSSGQYIATTSSTKLISNPYVYPPHPDRNMIETYIPIYISNGILKYDGLGEYIHTSFNSFIKVKGSTFDINAGSLEAFGSAYVENFIDFETSLSNTSVHLKSNFEKSSILFGQGQTFINTDEPNFTIYGPNVDIGTFQRLTPISTVGVINTLGTVSTYNSKPIQTLPQYASKAAAKLAGLTSGSEFLKVTNVNADDLQSGVEYKITTAGTPSLGTVGTYFTATGTETGTGVGTLYELEILI